MKKKIKWTCLALEKNVLASAAAFFILYISIFLNTIVHLQQSSNRQFVLFKRRKGNNKNLYLQMLFQFLNEIKALMKKLTILSILTVIIIK
jgi:hypothetical protein